MEWVVDKELNVVKGVYEDLLKGELYFPSVVDGSDDEILSVAESNDAFRALVDEAKGVMGYRSGSVSWYYLSFLLKTAPCFVEYTQGGLNMRKMVLCSNLNLCQRYKNVGTFRGTDLVDIKVVGKALLAVKLNKTRITNLSYPLYLKGATIRVVPLVALDVIAERLREKLSDATRAYRCVYLKDNGTSREIITTLSRDILLKFYDAEFVDKVMEGVSFDKEVLTNRGYVRVPELGASKYDSGVRAINLTKLKSVSPVAVNEVDTRFIEVDFNGIATAFSSGIGDIRDADILMHIANDLGVQISGTPTAWGIVAQMNEWFELSKTIGTTQFLRQIHLYMIDNGMLFGGYDGTPKSIKGQFGTVLPSSDDEFFSVARGTDGAVGTVGDVDGGTPHYSIEFTDFDFEGGCSDE